MPRCSTITVVPGYYDTLDYAELVAKLQSLTVRVRELILLKEEWGEDSDGTIVNAVAYNTEYRDPKKSGPRFLFSFAPETWAANARQALQSTRP